MEVDRLALEFDLEVRWAPYLLDPTTPPAGKPRRAMTQPGDAPTPLEERGRALGITFARGRTWTSNSLLALEAAEFLAEHPRRAAFHHAMFRAYFTDLADIGSVDAVVGIAEGAGIEGPPLREALERRALQDTVADALAVARRIGVTAVPTFVIDEQYAVVGAQDYEVFRDVLVRLGKTPRTDTDA